MATDLRPIVVDAGGLTAVERSLASMERAIRDVARAGGRPVVPAPVLGRVWRGGPRRQALLSRFLRPPHVAAVVVCAREHGARVVITSDRDDLRRLDADLALWSP